MPFTLHHGTSFLVSDESSDVRPDSDGGFFHLDTRFLSCHQLRLDGKRPIVLQASAIEDDDGWHFLTNPALDGAARATLGISVHRVVGGGLREEIAVESYGEGEARLVLSIALDSDFAYVLTVKKEAAGGGGDWHPHVSRSTPSSRELVLELREAGTAHRTVLGFSVAPDELHGDEARFRLHLRRREPWKLTLDVAPILGDRRVDADPGAPRRAAAGRRRRGQLQAEQPHLDTDHAVLRAAFAQASRDVAALRLKANRGEGDDGGGGDYAIAAGIPWYMDLFGRDSLIASFATVLHDPALARGTIEGLARLQGKKVDRLSEEAPGKILHEYRRGPLTPAARKLIPTYPYYGTIDATPLFLVTLSEYVRATGDLELARAHWTSVEAAVEWMRRYGDRDGDGFLEYQLDADVGLANQGWKDSSDSIQFRDGRIARPPIALVEVQGYALDARRRTAELARHLGHADQAERLEAEADALRHRIRERYWLEDRGFFAEALDGEKHRVDALTSNPGHLLWAGAVDARDAAALAKVLLGPELFSGFGVRTMGTREAGFNPISYHDGSVWPHDNALIAAGLARYGHAAEAARIVEGLLAAIARFPLRRPPELFCGYAADEYPTPVRYPTACSPQAWASAAVILLARTIAGLEVNALDRCVSVAPLAIGGMRWLELSRVPVGDALVDVSVHVEDGRAHAEVRGLPDGWERADAAAPGA
ncbi:amylo-alpha-1,6-glucosidase [Anaeromyxobacter oryzae]|uniref:Amylo-alpha-1,6-glucosidase n=1 Tax=Anaeromyxobacter oryzae TaxID=2918170 RepID=A0ABM7X084_9BACT|nr:glycogen debranching N-terminal domain-containing protein [Anaeromyxobacter oryzae]BDG05213.1 amylo-alpha-1,6-glucosidase [Anaeromyxobacter oryzae]